LSLTVRRYDQWVRRYFTFRCVTMHVTLIVILPVFAWLTRWQLDRATAGNTLSWAYTFEWPLFGGYALYVWWQLIHDDSAVTGSTRFDPVAESGDAGAGPQDEPGWALRTHRRGRVEIGRDDPGSNHHGSPPGDDAGADADTDADAVGEVEDPELAAYNRYLSDLNTDNRRKQW
jgi:hypothetical protein